MSYNTNNDLPDSVRNVLPEHAQNVFRKVFNNVYGEYEEDICFKIAWKAVKRDYAKDPVSGKWNPIPHNYLSH